jgi:hypothetical protein
VEVVEAVEVVEVGDGEGEVVACEHQRRSGSGVARLHVCAKC